MSLIIIKPMTLEHLDAVYEVELACFSIPWSKESLRKELDANSMAYYYVAAEGERIIGYAGMWHIVTEGHITNIAVLSEYRQKGVGNMLLNYIIDVAYRMEMIGLTLEVRMNNTAAQRLYTKNGFKPEGIRKNYYSDTKEDAIIMWKTL